MMLRDCRVDFLNTIKYSEVNFKCMNIKNILLVIAMIEFLVACKSSNKPPKEEPVYISSFDVGNGIQRMETYNSSNALIRKGYMSKKSKKIYEFVDYDSSGRNLLNYRFYNPIGELMYGRDYDKNGSFKVDHGTFFSFNQIESSELALGDSLKFSVFAAKPYGTTFQVFGKSSNGEKFELENRSTQFPFCREYRFLPTKKGEFILVYEVEFRDTINHFKKVEEGSVTFKVGK